MSPDRCAGCGAVQRYKPKIDGVCPYCGGKIATGRGSFQAIEPIEEPAPLRAARRRHARTWGVVQLAGAGVMIWIFVSGTRIPIIATFLAGMVAAHGLYRIIFGSGPNRDDEDYDGDL